MFPIFKMIQDWSIISICKKSLLEGCQSKNNNYSPYFWGLHKADKIHRNRSLVSLRHFVDWDRFIHTSSVWKFSPENLWPWNRISREVGNLLSRHQKVISLIKLPTANSEFINLFANICENRAFSFLKAIHQNQNHLENAHCTPFSFSVEEEQCVIGAQSRLRGPTWYCPGAPGSGKDRLKARGLTGSQPGLWGGQCCQTADQRVSGPGGPPTGQLPCGLAAPCPSPREASLQGQCQEAREAKMLPQAHPEHVHIKMP